MKKITTYFLVLLFWLVSNDLLAQESKYKALYLFNFTKYIEWSGDKIIIGIIGNSPVLLELENYAKRNPKIELVKISGSESITDCDMIFLPEAQTRNFELVQGKMNNSTILVAENESLISKGAEMAFFTENDKLRFVVNKSELDATGMKVSNSLLGLGKVVK